MEHVLATAPVGKSYVYFAAATSATAANELAANVAMQQYAKNNGVEDMGKVCVVGFNNSNHGDSQTTLSFSSDDANVAG